MNSSALFLPPHREAVEARCRPIRGEVVGSIITCHLIIKQPASHLGWGRLPATSLLHIAQRLKTRKQQLDFA